MSVDMDERTAVIWALASDEHMLQLMAWQSVKARAASGGFNGVLASDLSRADKAMTVLVEAADTRRKP